MTTFVSQDPHHEIAHPTLAEAAGSEYFTAKFTPREGVGQFTAKSEPIAKALRALIDGGKVRGVKELPKPKGKPPTFTLDAAIARAEELSKTPPVTLAGLGEPFGLDEAALKAKLAELVKATPEAAEKLKALGVEL